jgi:hypothetical protein
MIRLMLLWILLMLLPSIALTQNGYPKRIVLTNGDTVNCYTDKQVRLIGKTIVKVQELSTELKLVKKQSDLHAERVKALLNATDSLGRYIVEYREIIETKDTIIHDLHTAINFQSQDISSLKKEVVRVKRKGTFKAVGWGIGGLGIGVGVGFLIGFLR